MRRQIPQASLREYGARWSVAAGGDVTLEGQAHQAHAGAHFIHVLHKLLEATHRSSRREETDDLEARRIRLLTSAATFLGEKRRLVTARLPDTALFGESPADEGASAGIPIFQTCSTAPMEASSPGVESAGTQGMAPGTSSLPRISVVDDDDEMHLFLKDLEGLGHFKIAGAFHTAAQALDGLPLDRPDAVIMDVRLPDSSGIDCTNKLKTILPELPILILTGFPDRQCFFRSLMGGARGFLVKPVSPQELLNGMREVIRGEFSLARQVIPFLVELVEQVSGIVHRSELSRREEEILICLFHGMSDKEISNSLGIGTATVHTHMHRLFEKLGVRSRREIVSKCLRLE